MNFIEELYYGNINPNEKRYDGHTDYAKAMRRFCNSENELNKMLTEKRLYIVFYCLFTLSRGKDDKVNYWQSTNHKKHDVRKVLL